MCKDVLNLKNNSFSRWKKSKIDRKNFFLEPVSDLEIQNEQFNLRCRWSRLKIGH